MVEVNELYITPDNKKMIIDVSVRDDEYHKDAYLTEIVLDTQDTFVPEIGQPSEEWVAKRAIDDGDYVAKIAWEAGKVDEYHDIICASCQEVFRPHHCGCGHHHHHHHHDECVCKGANNIEPIEIHPHCHKTGETGRYCNPITIVSYDLETKTAIKDFDGTQKQIPLVDSLYYKIDETIYQYKFNEFREFSYEKPEHVRHARIEIKQEDICQPFTDTMFFVWIKCEGVDPETPCSLNKPYTLGVCINQFTIYRRFICIMEELLKDCDIPKYFIDLYLRWQAVKMAISTGNYAQAILLWKRFFLFHHQRPLWESPQYDRFWVDWLKDGFLPFTNYEHPVYGWGGSFFNQQGSHCRTCRR